MTGLKQTRRAACIGAVAAMAATGTLIDRLPAPGAQKTFVLVHGAWHGGWCWRRVADLLEKKGHKVFTPTMTGLGACSHLLSKDVNLTTHITDIANVIKWENLSDIVLVGHSYGGIMISGVAEQMARQDRLDRVPRRLHAGERHEPRRRPLRRRRAMRLRLRCRARTSR